MEKVIAKADLAGLKTSTIRENPFNSEEFKGSLYETRDVLDKTLDYENLKSKEEDRNVLLLQKNVSSQEYTTAAKNLKISVSEVASPSALYKNITGVQIGDKNTEGTFWEKPAFLKKSSQSQKVSNEECYYYPLGSNNTFIEDSYLLAGRKFNNLIDLTEGNIETNYAPVSHTIEISKYDLNYDNACHVDFRGVQSSSKGENLLKFTEGEDSWKSCWFNVDSFSSLNNNFLFAEDALKLTANPTSTGPWCYFRQRLSLSEPGFYSVSCYMKGSKEINVFGLSFVSATNINDLRGDITSYSSELNVSSSGTDTFDIFKVDTRWRCFSRTVYLSTSDIEKDLAIYIGWPHPSAGLSSSLSLMGLKVEKGYPSNYDYRNASYTASLGKSKTHLIGFKLPRFEELKNWTLSYLRYIPSPSQVISTNAPSIKCVDTLGDLTFGYKDDQIIVNDTVETLPEVDVLKLYNRWERVLYKYKEGKLSIRVKNEGVIGGSNSVEYSIPEKNFSSKNTTLPSTAGSIIYSILLGAQNENSELKTYDAFYKGLVWWTREITEEEEHALFYDYLKISTDKDLSDKIAVPENTAPIQMALWSENLEETSEILD